MAPFLDPTDRGGGGNVGIIRSPLRATTLPDNRHEVGSSRQGWESCEVKVLVPSIACIRTVSRSGACGGNEARSARMSKPRPPCGCMRSGGNDLGGEQIWRPEHKGISAASKSRSAKSRVRGLEAGSRPTLLLGKADDTKEETGKCTSWDRRGMGSGI